MDLSYFKLSEFNCQETDENNMNEDFLIKLDELRHICGFPFIVTSGYRSSIHSLEIRKEKPGTHAEGIAADIKIAGAGKRHIIVSNAIKLGFNGIGIGENFVHVDTRNGIPVMWTYY
jgi:uncharacterized protein YcbK (DUF882 family)